MGRVHRLDVHQHLVISGVRRQRNRLHVRLRDRSGSRHWIRFDLPVGTIDACVRRVSAWKAQSTLLTYVTGRGVGVLIDDDEFFRSAFAAGAA
jgi:hypothetical protein